MRLLRALLLALVLTVALSACDMTLRFATTIEADGSGRFALTVQVDKELRDLMEGAHEQGLTDSSGVADLDALFGSLHAAGWSTERSEPDGGLRLVASTTFADRADFDRVLSDIRGARTDQETGFGDVTFELGFDTSSSFFRSDAGFHGVVDTTQDTSTPEAANIVDSLAQNFHLEIQSTMPGAVALGEGDGVVRGRTVVWRPRFGTRAVFDASSSSLRLGPLLAVFLPALVLLAALGWFVLGRRKEHHTLTEELVAIKLDDAAPTNDEPRADDDLPDRAVTLRAED